MRARGNEKEIGSKQYRLKKDGEYLSIEKLQVREPAARILRHKPYSNDFGREKNE